MVKLTLNIDGMMCGMCESHLCETVRKAWPDAKVHASHRKGTMEIIRQEDLSDEDLHRVLDPTGYRLKKIAHETQETGLKKGSLLGRLLGR